MNKNIFPLLIVIFILNILYVKGQTPAAVSAEDLAKQLANPVASLISIPFQNNFDFGVGPLNGFKYTLNIQPVIPVSIGKKWNMVSRTIIPIISQSDVSGIEKNEIGLGDIAQSIFFSPKEVKNGMVWGIGPVFLLPTASDNLLGLNKWAVGPNALLLKMKGQLTYGALINQMWSYAGNGINDINASFFQPFFTFSSKSGTSITLASENTQDWKNDIFGGFAGIYFAKVVTFGKQMVQLGGGPKIYYGNNPFTPNWGLRFNVILLFPKK